MSQRPIHEWWNDLDPATRRWMAENPGCLVLPRTIANAIHAAVRQGTDQDQHGELQLSAQDHEFIRAQAGAGGNQRTLQPESS